MQQSREKYQYLPDVEEKKIKPDEVRVEIKTVGFDAAIGRAIAKGEALATHLVSCGVRSENAQMIPAHIRSLSRKKEILTTDLDLIRTGGRALLDNKVSPSSRSEVINDPAFIICCPGCIGIPGGVAALPCMLEHGLLDCVALSSCPEPIAVAGTASTAGLIGCAVGLGAGLLCTLGIFSYNKCKERSEPQSVKLNMFNELCQDIEKDLLPFTVQAMPAPPSVGRK